MSKPRGLPGTKFFFGHILQFRKGPLRFIEKCHEEIIKKNAQEELI